MLPSFIGLSTGRAGSRYLTALLNEAGVRTAHEQSKSLPVFLDRDGDLRGEISAHFVTQAQAPLDVHILHFTRHPQPFVSSLIKFGFWEMNAPHIHPFLRSKGDPISDSFLYWVDWNRRILDLRLGQDHLSTYLRIEEINREFVADFSRTVGGNFGISKTEPKWEEAQEFAEIPWDVQGEVRDMMGLLGYA